MIRPDFVSVSEDEIIIKKEFAERAECLHNDNAADIPPVKRERHDIIEEEKQHPFQEPEDHAAEHELPALLHRVAFGGAGVDKKAALQESGKGHHDQCDRIKNIDADPETFMADDIDPEIQRACRYGCDAEFQSFFNEIPGEKRVDQFCRHKQKTWILFVKFLGEFPVDQIIEPTFFEPQRRKTVAQHDRSGNEQFEK